MGNIETPKFLKMDLNTSWITAEKQVKGKRTREREFPGEEQLVCSWAGGPCLSIRASLGECKENQDTVEKPRARVDTEGNTSIYALGHTFYFIHSHFHEPISSYSSEKTNCQKAFSVLALLILEAG